MRPAAALLCVLAGAAALSRRGVDRSPRARGGGGDDGGYYAALGVSRDASAGDIARAYRRRSLACHPDKGGDAEQFKKLNEAKEVLGDAEKRRAYDRFGAAGVDQRGAGRRRPGGAGNVDARTAAMFEQMFGSFGSAFGEAFGGGGGVFGGGGFGRARWSRRRDHARSSDGAATRFRRRGADLLLDATVPLAEALGGGPVVRVERPDGTTFARRAAGGRAVLKRGSRAAEGEGMPVRGAPSRRGTLFVRVLVAFRADLALDDRVGAARSWAQAREGARAS
ncbi:DnaJ-like protein [Aureococcus anophagefferens]|uniref:DnaJ-like protein n=2 Tax=Aureococcus anophagefferens TaxID=44056 RepID=A0ABR1G4U6_AURAN